MQWAEKSDGGVICLDATRCWRMWPAPSTADEGFIPLHRGREEAPVNNELFLHGDLNASHTHTHKASSCLVLKMARMICLLCVSLHTFRVCVYRFQLVPHVSSCTKKPFRPAGKLISSHLDANVSHRVALNTPRSTLLNSTRCSTCCSLLRERTGNVWDCYYPGFSLLPSSCPSVYEHACR